MDSESFASRVADLEDSAYRQAKQAFPCDAPRVKTLALLPSAMHLLCGASVPMALVFFPPMDLGTSTSANERDV
jgi:hypothetical protein